MARPPRDQHKDRLASHTLIYQSYAQIGMLEVSPKIARVFPQSTERGCSLQSAAGFLTYFVVMGENGFLPSKLVGIREQWDNDKLYVTDSYGQDWVRFCVCNVICYIVHVLCMSSHTGIR